MVMRHILLIILSTLMFTRSYSQESDFLSVMTTKDELDLTDISLVSIPTQGPFMIAGNAIHSLVEDNETATITFPEEMFIEDMIWTGSDFAIKSRHEVYMLNDIETPIFVFEEEDFQIFPWDEQRIFIIYNKEEKDNVFMGNLKHKRVKRLVSFNEKVVYVTPIDDAALIVTTENIYLFTDKECIKYMNFWMPVHSATMTSKGLFFATDEEICVLTGVDSFILLFDSGCKKLLFDNKDLYIVTKESDLVKCNIDLLEF